MTVWADGTQVSYWAKLIFLSYSREGPQMMYVYIALSKFAVRRSEIQSANVAS